MRWKRNRQKPGPKTGKKNRDRQSWYSGGEAMREYEKLSVDGKLEFVRDFIYSVSVMAMVRPFGGRAKIDALARVFVYVLIPSEGFPFSGYRNSMDENRNSLIKEIRDFLFARDPDRMIMEILQWFKRQEAADGTGEKNRPFYEMLIVLAVAGGASLYTFDVSNPGFFSDTLNTFTGEKSPARKKDGFSRLALGSAGTEELSYGFRYPILRLEGDLKSIGIAYANILGTNPDANFAVFDFRGSFCGCRDAGNLFWPLIDEADARPMVKALSNLMEDRRYAGADTGARICVLTDDPERLFGMEDGLLLKSMDHALQSGVVFVYGTDGERIEPVDTAWYTDRIGVQGIERAEESAPFLAAARYDEAYYEAVLKKRIGRKRRGESAGDRDILLDEIRNYIIAKGEVCCPMIMNRFGIGEKRLDAVLSRLEDEGVVSGMGTDGSRIVFDEDDLMIME